MNLFSFLHYVFIAYVVAIPLFSSSPHLLGLHILILLSLLTHWYMNNDVCFLTMLEHRFFPREGARKEDLFFQRLVGPVYNVQHRDVHILTLVILLVTVYKYLQHVK